MGETNGSASACGEAPGMSLRLRLFGLMFFPLTWGGVEGDTLRHPAIVVEDGNGAEDLRVAPVSHTYIEPARAVTHVAPSCGLTGFVHLGGPLRVKISDVRVDRARRRASEEEVAYLSSLLPVRTRSRLACD